MIKWQRKTCGVNQVSVGNGKRWASESTGLYSYIVCLESGDLQRVTKTTTQKNELLGLSSDLNSCQFLPSNCQNRHIESTFEKTVTF